MRSLTTGFASVQSLRLPNGYIVAQVNAAETGLQYRNIFVHREYLKHGISLAPGDVVFDVGANVGISSLFFHWEVSDVAIFAFEPARPIFDALLKNFLTYRIKGKAFNCALSDRRGRGVLTYYPRATAMTSLYADVDHDTAVTRKFLLNSGFDVADVEDMLEGRHKTEEQPCALRRLSDVLRRENINQLDLLKINVEKSECDVLGGINETDWPMVRQIVMQVHNMDGRFAAVRRELASRGFKLVIEQDPLLWGTDIYDLVAIR